jgi:wyosine [tRNA(Phe)-imidazoG37] synthetase (radical SAM superfamily)
MESYRYIFGPVPSRRLGLSLGIDLTPLKTCNSDCIFCQLGCTVRRTVRRTEYVPTADVIAEIQDWLAQGRRVDHITLAGSGEPTLHSRFGDVLAFVRANSCIPAALLSNGMLFYRPDVREAAAEAALVKLTLSAWDQPSFERLHRPHPSLRFDRMIEGYRKFRAQYRGELWIEVFLARGVNSAVDQVRRIAAIAQTIAPDHIHLNTAVRPPAEASVGAVAAGRLEELAALFSPVAEVVAEFRAPSVAGRAVDEHAVMALLRRHAATLPEMQSVLGGEAGQLTRLVRRLLRAKRIRSDARNGRLYYRAC